MAESQKFLFSFDLWTMPWIGLEREDGGIERAGIEQTLLRAHEFRGIFEVSPLVVVGIHRLLTAILQQIFSPGSEEELKNYGLCRAFQRREFWNSGRNIVTGLIFSRLINRSIKALMYLQSLKRERISNQWHTSRRTSPQVPKARTIAMAFRLITCSARHALPVDWCTSPLSRHQEGRGSSHPSTVCRLSM